MQRHCSDSNTKNLVSLDKMFLSPRPCAPSRSIVSFSACDESLVSLSAVRKRNDKEILFFVFGKLVKCLESKQKIHCS